MRGFSKAIIAGNVTRDPELRTTASGASVCSFSVAVNRVFKDSNGAQKEDVSFIDCSAWGGLGEMISQYVKKGSGVLVCGRLSQRAWEDKNGQKRSRVEIVVEDFNFTGPSADRGDDSGARPSFGAQKEVMNQEVEQDSQDFAPEEMPDAPIDLSEIPF
ncbi:single-stranded DNA-binding protein [Candidatus Saccharibacteria bacterium]|nr:single-stranded DNA-binding protein [Candidatus Saccharibacteria bacterium]